MPVTFSFQPDPNLVSAAAMRAGRASYLDQLRRERERQQMELLRMQQQQRQFDVSQANAFQRQQMAQEGTLGRMLLGTTLNEQARQRDFAQRQALAEQQFAQQESIERQRHEYGLEDLMRQQQGRMDYLSQANLGYEQRQQQAQQFEVEQLAQQQTRQQRQELNQYMQRLNPADQTRVRDLFEKRQRAVRDPLMNDAQRREVLQLIDQDLEDFYQTATEIPQESLPGAEYQKDGRVFRNDQRGEPVYQGLAPDVSMQDWYDKNRQIVDLGDGNRVMFHKDPDPSVRTTPIRLPTTQETDLERQEALAKQSQAKVDRIYRVINAIESFVKSQESEGVNKLPQGTLEVYQGQMKTLLDIAIAEAMGLTQSGAMAGNPGNVALPGVPAPAGINPAQMNEEDAVRVLQEMIGRM